MDEFLEIVFGMVMAYFFGSQLGRSWYPYGSQATQGFYGGVAIFLGAAFLAHMVVVPVLKGVLGGAGTIARLPFAPSGSAFKQFFASTVPGRRIFGLFANGLVRVMAAMPLYGVPLLLFLGWQIYALALLPGMAWLAMLALLIAAMWKTRAKVLPLKIWLGQNTKELRYWLRSMTFGRGGSAAYASLFDDWAEAWQPGNILLGGSLFDPRFKVGGWDDRHFITIATTRSGKGTSCIIPNLLTWPGSALVIDVKGQNAAVTAEARRNMGQTVRIVDPFGVLKSIGVNDPVARWNPLLELDPNGRKAFEDIDAIGESLIVQSPKSDPFWDETSRALINGLIAHAITWPEYPDEERNLGMVHHWMTDPDGPPLKQMLENYHPGLGGMVRSIGGGLAEFSDNAKRDILGTARNHIKWLNSLAMRDCLSEAQFSLSDLKRRPTTIYLVIPPDLLNTHNRFSRLFINMALTAIVKDPLKAADDVLILLDEFYSLGRMEKLMEVMANLAGYGARVWPIVQNIGQIEQLYEKNWETFLGQAGRWQVFAMNDKSTMDYLSDRMGYHITWEQTQSYTGQKEWSPRSPTQFRTPQELAMDSNRSGGRQLIYTEGGDTHFLKRQPYYGLFKKGEYRPDPYERRGVRFVDDDTVAKTDDVQTSPDWRTIVKTPNEQKAMNEIQRWTGSKNSWKGKINDLIGSEKRKALPRKER